MGSPMDFPYRQSNGFAKIKGAKIKTLLYSIIFGNVWGLFTFLQQFIPTQCAKSTLNKTESTSN